MQELYSCSSQLSCHEASVIDQVSLADVLSVVASSYVQFRIVCITGLFLVLLLHRVNG
jgi:hypothetical protein